MSEFSHATRSQAIKRFESEEFDLLIVGGGITGAACARDATSRGLKVALVEKGDFAIGTSSRSSKLIHGGLRYLENFEFALVFEALSERSLLLRTVPHMVRPLPFYFPVYEGDPHGRFQLGLGMLLYDLLALFRAPGRHRRLGRKKFLKEIPFLRPEGLTGGFQYYDASMWDDALVIEVMRSASAMGAATANYVEALSPLRDAGSAGGVTGYRSRDLETGREFNIRARRTILATGPWTDELGAGLSPEWERWLSPSRGIHLVFDLKRIPIPGAMVMSHPEDGRISFVMPRPDLGAGVTIVGTTDGPTPADPEKAEVPGDDVHYLMRLLDRYFAGLKLNTSDILSTYIGVRPLVAPNEKASLQKVSREHEIKLGPGGVVMVAGGKYTTHRKMAEEIVDFALEARPAKPWSRKPAKPRTREPINPEATPARTAEARWVAQARVRTEGEVPLLLFDRYGAEAIGIRALQQELKRAGLAVPEDPPGFPWVGAQLLHHMRNGMVERLEDFYFRRMPLALSRADHGMPWVEPLARIFAWEQARNSDRSGSETRLSDQASPSGQLGNELARRESEATRAVLARMDEWKGRL